jgi:hypothetical protein
MHNTRDFEAVFAAEIEEIARRRGPDRNPPAKGSSPSTALGLTGLSLSGGGIRSAAFCLGVVQSLAKARLLPHVDYLSTVSGGGYTGAALSTLLNHDRLDAITTAERFPLRMPSADDPPALRHLRNGSSYLTPPGILSSLRLPTVVIRVMVLGTLMLLPLLLAAVLVTNFFYEVIAPMALEHGVDVIHDVQSAYPALVTLGVFGVLVAFFPFAMTLLRRRVDVVGRRRYDYVAAVAFAVAVFMLALWPVAMAIDYVVVHSTTEVNRLLVGFASAAWESRTLHIAAAVFAGVAVLLGAARSAIGRTMFRNVMMLLAAVSAPGFLFAVFLGLCLWQIDNQFIMRLHPNGHGGVVLTHLDERLRDEVLEGYGSANAVFHRDATRTMDGQTVADLQDDEWLIVFRVNGRRFYAHRLGRTVRVVPMPASFAPDPKDLALLVFALFSLLGTVLFLDVNVTSLHLFYRDQLCNVFLRAEAPDGTLCAPDSIKLSHLRGLCAPYHLINATINLTTSTDESLRGRNGDVFIFSKRFVGSEHTGWSPTPLMEHGDPNLDIGTAMAISAAAASPNMGSYTSRAVSFLLTLLGARMGYWLPNPQRVGERRRLPPGSIYLLREALGLLDATGSYVNVSDGGHFENLGVYELLRRRCAVIVVADGEEDGALGFGALATLARFAMIDFGIGIDIDLSEMRRDEKGFSRAHCAVGRIDYGAGQAPGVLVYLKATVTGDENLYVRNYNDANRDFPHEATVDQFFSETQFEVYRALGEHIGDGLWAGATGRREDLVGVVATAAGAAAETAAGDGVRAGAEGNGARAATAGAGGMAAS